MESSFIDPGIGTAPKPDAGPSSGQVPRVALDESSEIVARLDPSPQLLRREPVVDVAGVLQELDAMPGAPG
jgi:hypothetical protein